MDLYLIPEAYCLGFQEIIQYAQSEYKQLFDAEDWTLDLVLLHWLLDQLFRLNIRMPSNIILWRFRT